MTATSFELLSQAQADMRAGHCSGGAGVLASALVWSAATVAALLLSPVQAVWVLLLGGMAIPLLAMLVCRLLGRSGAHGRHNPLAPLAWASVLWLICCLPLAYGASLLRIEWFFPAMLLVIGGRYLGFHTLFGLRVYWLLGLALAGAGYGLGKASTAPSVSAFAGATIEFAFAVAILIADRRAQRAATAAPAALAGAA